MSSNESVTERLDQLSSEFQELEPRERLELLLEFAESLPPLPARYQAERDAGEHRIHECQTPVFIWVELNENAVQIAADVAPEAPTVKGFVGVLLEIFNGSSPNEILALQQNVVQRLGLIEALGMTRMRGLQAIAFYIRKQVARLVEPG